MSGGKILGVILLFFAFGLRPSLKYVFNLSRSSMDTQLGQLELLSPTNLSAAYEHKRTLIIGGTRGVGRGIARVIAEAGGDVTVVGRSAVSGASAEAYLKSHSKSPEQRIYFLAGDLGTSKAVKSLVRTLAEQAKRDGKFDYLVVSAAVFPDWNNPLNEDGLEKGHAIAVVGRYAAYRHMLLFLKDGGRVLNVFASGQKSASFDRALLTAQRNFTGLVEALTNYGASGELMQIGLQESGKFSRITRVSTHPGLLGTELHDGQGWAMDLLEPIFVAIIGISEEECGHRQASILASPRLPTGQLSLVDDDMIGRTRSADLNALAADHLPWLMSWLNERTEI